MRGLNCRERYHTRDLMSFHFIFVTNFIRDKNSLYGMWYLTVLEKMAGCVALCLPT